MRLARRAAWARHAAVGVLLVAAMGTAWARRDARERAVAWSPSPVDLNAAGTAELTILPGVGPALAAAIVADRDANGAFRSVDDLDRVRGIGPGLLARIRPHAVAGDAPAAAPAYAAR